MTRAYLVGDTHSDASFVAGVMKAAKRSEPPVNTIIQLGDFGYTFDRNVIASISAWLDRDPENRFYWIDGNHDQHDYLAELTTSCGHDEPISMYAFPFNRQMFHEHMFYVPRGATFQVGDAKVMGVGGAFSIDKSSRRAHVSWWPQELITQTDVHRAIENGKDVDVIVSHDAPPTQFLTEWLDQFGYKVDQASAINRHMLGWIVEEVKPKQLFHGHYHRRYTAPYTHKDGRMTEVYGVAANFNERGYIDSTVVMGSNVLLVDW
jgi:predicted phosphodiesterase